MERGVFLFYELYIDSLFLINFVMNLYLLELVNCSLMRTATRRRIVLGAAIGAVLYLVPFFLGGPVWLRLLIGVPAATVLMVKVTFRVKSLKAFWKFTERLLLYSFLLGGILLFLIRCFPQIRKALVSVFGIMGMGAVLFLLLSYCRERKRKERNFCKVVLIREEVQVAVNALLDTGNSLVEPISGKPVSILEKSVFESLWKNGAPDIYRAIPYHSIGKKKGILPGYVIPEMLIEAEGITKSCRDVYVGVSEDLMAGVEGYKMILNPSMLTD